MRGTSLGVFKDRDVLLVVGMLCQISVFVEGSGLHVANQLEFEARDAFRAQRVVAVDYHFDRVSYLVHVLFKSEGCFALSLTYA